MFGQSRIMGKPFAILERNWEKNQQNKSKLQVEVLVLIKRISLVLCRSQRWTNVWYLKSQHSLGQVIFRPLPDPELFWLARANTTVSECCSLWTFLISTAVTNCWNIRRLPYPVGMTAEHPRLLKDNSRALSCRAARQKKCCSKAP